MCRITKKANECKGHQGNAESNCDYREVIIVRTKKKNEVLYPSNSVITLSPGESATLESPASLD